MRYGKFVGCGLAGRDGTDENLLYCTMEIVMFLGKRVLLVLSVVVLFMVVQALDQGNHHR